MTLSDVFTRIYAENVWASGETRSGGGSELVRTVEVREWLPAFLRSHGVTSLLDAGCGDWNWQRHIDWGELDYIGVDLVPELASEAARHFGRPLRTFFVADITREALPLVQMVLCRAVLFHLSLENARRALENCRRAAARYLMATTHPLIETNTDIQDGEWRRLNLQAEPFCLPEPVEWIWDGPGHDGQLAVWDLRGGS